MIDQNPDDMPEFLRDLLSQLPCQSQVEQAQQAVIEAIDNLIEVCSLAGMDSTFGACVNVDRVDKPFGMVAVTIVGGDTFDTEELRREWQKKFRDSYLPQIDEIRDLFTLKHGHAPCEIDLINKAEPEDNFPEDFNPRLN